MPAYQDRLFDVFGLGAIAVDMVGLIDSWPEQGAKVKLNDFVISDGGLIGTALTTVSRLGGKAAIAAKLGNSFLAERAFKSLRGESIDISNVIREDHDPVLSFILSSSENSDRNIFFSRKNVSYPLPQEFPDQEWFNKTKTLLIDHGTGIAGIEAAKMAKQNGVKVIIDAERLEPGIKELLTISDHIVVGQKFAMIYTGTSNEAEMLHSLRERNDQVVIITKGEQGLVGLDISGIFKLDAFKVNTIDTTGCGDVFHGAYALGIARGWDLKKCCLFASAASAMSSTKTGGREGIPSNQELIQFLHSRGISFQ
jgi:sulfofructose kinase